MFLFNTYTDAGRQNAQEAFIKISSLIMIFTARRYAKRGIYRRRVCVCVSVTLRYCIKMAKRRIMQIMPHDSLENLVF